MVALFLINMFIKEFCKLSMKEVVSLFSGCLAIFILSQVDYESKFLWNLLYESKNYCPRARLTNQNSFRALEFLFWYFLQIQYLLFERVVMVSWMNGNICNINTNFNLD